MKIKNVYLVGLGVSSQCRYCKLIADKKDFFPYHSLVSGVSDNTRKITSPFAFPFARVPTFFRINIVPLVSDSLLAERYHMREISFSLNCFYPRNKKPQENCQIWTFI